MDGDAGEMILPPDPLLLSMLEILAAAEHRLTEAADRLAIVAPTAIRMAGDTRWSTEAARRFHASAEQWQSDVTGLSALTGDARNDLRRLSERIGAWAWGRGV